MVAPMSAHGSLWETDSPAEKRSVFSASTELIEPL